MPSKSHGNALVRDALELSSGNMANMIWVDTQPTTDMMEPDYVYAWVDSNNNLTIGSLDDSGSLLAMTLNVSVDSGDTGLIGGLLG